MDQTALYALMLQQLQSQGGQNFEDLPGGSANPAPGFRTPAGKAPVAPVAPFTGPNYGTMPQPEARAPAPPSGQWGAGSPGHPFQQKLIGGVPVWGFDPAALAALGGARPSGGVGVTGPSPLSRPVGVGAPSPAPASSATPTPTPLAGGFPTSGNVNWEQNPVGMAQGFQDFYKKMGEWKDPFGGQAPHIPGPYMTGGSSFMPAQTNAKGELVLGNDPFGPMPSRQPVWAPGDAPKSLYEHQLLMSRLKEKHQEDAMKEYQRLLGERTTHAAAQAAGATQLDVERMRQAGTLPALLGQRLINDPNTPTDVLGIIAEKYQNAAQKYGQQKLGGMGVGVGGGGEGGAPPPVGVGGSGPLPVGVAPRRTNEQLAIDQAKIPTREEVEAILGYMKGTPASSGAAAPAYSERGLMERLAANQKLLQHPETMQRIVGAMQGGPGGRTLPQQQDALERLFIQHGQQFLPSGTQSTPMDFGGMGLLRATTGRLTSRHPGAQRRSYNISGPGGTVTNRSVLPLPFAEKLTGFGDVLPNLRQTTDVDYRRNADTVGALLKAIEASQGR